MFIEGFLIGFLIGTAITLFVFNLFANKWIKKETTEAYGKGFRLGAGIQEASKILKSNLK